MEQLGQSIKKADRVLFKLLNLEPTERQCIDCGKSFVARFAVICDGCAKKRKREKVLREEEERRLLVEKEVHQRIIQSGISDYWYPRGTFKESNPDIHREAFCIALDYAQEFTLQSPSLVFSGDYGTGKTHLAMCIANHILRQKGIPVIVKKARDLLLELRNLYGDDTKNTEKGYLDYVLSVPLLVLDDVGLDKLTEWTEGVYWTVFDRRMERQLPIIITTKYSMTGLQNDIGDRIGFGAKSRLLRMIEGRVIELSGGDLR